MDHLQTFAISAAGMTAERTRVEVAALNLANVHTVVEGGQGYRPLRVVLQAPPATPAFGAMVASNLHGPMVGVEAVDHEPRRVLEPGHPLADAAGFVAYPAVDTTAEMVGLMAAMRAYEANVAAMDAARTVALKTLEIGG